MSIDMYLSASQTQATSVSSMTKQQVEGYEALQKAINDFTLNAPFLTGKAYDSAKTYFSTVLYPLAQGGILLSEAVERAVKKFPEDYIAQVDSGDLKQSELEEKIRQVDHLIGQATEINRQLTALKPPVTGIALHLNSNTALLDLYGTMKQMLEEKLQKLLEFNASSPTIFADIKELEQALLKGLAQTKTAFNASAGTFTIPPANTLDWRDTITDYQERHTVEDKIEVKKIERPNGAVMYQVYKNGELDEDATNELAIEIGKDDLKTVEAFLKGAGYQIGKNNGVIPLLDTLFGKRELDDSITQHSGYNEGVFFGNLVTLIQSGAEFIGGGLWLLGGGAGSLALAPVTGGGSVSAIPTVVVGGTTAIWGHATVIGGMSIHNIMSGDNYSEIKNTYNGIKDAPEYPEGFEGRQNGTKTNKVKNKSALSDLRQVESGEWKKIYKDGFDKQGKKISIHYFQSKSGRVFNVKVKTGWSNP